MLEAGGLGHRTPPTGRAGFYSHRGSGWEPGLASPGASPLWGFMASRTITLIDEGRALAVDAVVHRDALRLAPATLERALGWELKPQGLCRDETCIPVRDRAALVHADGLDLAALAGLLDRPIAIDPTEGVAVLGAPAAARAHRLASTEAPDFTLPDLDGRLHSLHDQRGKKTLLIAWASW